MNVTTFDRVDPGPCDGQRRPIESGNLQTNGAIRQRLRKEALGQELDLDTVWHLPDVKLARVGLAPGNAWRARGILYPRGWHRRDRSVTLRLAARLDVFELIVVDRAVRETRVQVAVPRACR